MQQRDDIILRPTRTKGAAGTSLYKPESEIAALVLGAGAKNWASIAAVWEREGLPRIDPMTGMRFWPAVQSFLMRRHGIIDAAVPTQPDGSETW
jgi:hypothetical protein